MRHNKSLARGLAAVILISGLALAACGSRADVALPKRPSHAQLARIVPATLSVRQFVVLGYEGYWQAANEAVNSRNASAATTILTGYVPASAIPGLISGMRVLWHRDEAAFGGPVFHIITVKMTGARTAAVHDCIDLSHTGFQNRKTGQIIGGLGQSHDYLITTLALTGRRWLVTGAIPVVRSCTY
jgi:hypothetical protein